MTTELTIYNLWVVTEWWKYSGTSASDTLHTSKESAETAATETRERLVALRATEVVVDVLTLDEYMSMMRSEARYEGEAAERDRLSDGC